MIEDENIEYVAIDLPRPISTNSLWRPTPRGMCKTQAYKDWLTEAGLRLNTQRPGKVEGPYSLIIQVSHAWRGDLDNAAKATSDLLQAHGVISNDRMAQCLVMVRANVPGMRVIITPNDGSAE